MAEKIEEYEEIKLSDKKLKDMISFTGISDRDSLDNLFSYGVKMFYKFKNSQYQLIPTEKSFIEDIVSNSFLLAYENFDSEKANFKTFFIQKIRGEMLKHVSKNETLKKHFKKESHSGDYVTSFDSNEETELVKVDNKDSFKELEENDLIRRQLSATRMATSELPELNQRIIRLSSEYEKLSEAAELIDMELNEFKEILNASLSLVFKKVLRSKHLSGEEREAIENRYKEA
jgi:DNA-directed RNA polymerase specialized sigma subunit